MDRIPESEAIARLVDARRFNEFMGGNRFRQQEYRRLAREAVTLGVPPGGKVLDVGTGPGFVAIEVARLLQGTGCEVVGLDLSSAMLALAAENAAQEGLNGMLTWREGDAKAMPFDDGEFDLIVCNDSLHHWEDPLPVFDEMARVLKVDGKCIVHDSKRLRQWLPRFVSWLIGLMIPADFRVHYWNSIQSSYTPEELQAVLERSRLRGWHIVEDFMDLMVVTVRPSQPMTSQEIEDEGQIPNRRNLLGGDSAETQQVLNTLPLVKEGLITFDIIPLMPYPGFARLFSEGT